MAGGRRFSQAISEGSGISLVAEVAGAEDARVAEESGADALFVSSGRDRELAAMRDATDLPILFSFDGERVETIAAADACVLDATSDGDRLRDSHFELAHDFECVVRVVDEDQLRLVLDELDPEMFLLSARSAEHQRLEQVLGLLPDVPAGKLAIADLGPAGPDELAELERAGIDAVVLTLADVQALGRAPDRP